MKDMTIYAWVPGFPNIELTIGLPINEPTKVRREGITFDIHPTNKKGTYLMHALKGRLRINTIIIKEKE